MTLQNDTDGMLDVFLFESSRLLERLEALLLERQDADCFSAEDINEIFRIVHTIKGSAAMMFYDNISQVAHKLEDVFYFVRESHPDGIPHGRLVERSLAAADFMNREIGKIRNGEKADGDAEAVLQDLDEFLTHIKGGLKELGISLPQEHTDSTPGHFYIAPAAGPGSRYYRVVIRYAEGTLRSNMRAYAATYALRNVAEELLYYPDDIVSNDASEEVIMRDGFVMFLRTKPDSMEKIRELIPRVAVDAVDIEEISSARYGMGPGPHPQADVEEPAGVERGRPEEGADLRFAVPGDYVLRSNEAGQGRTLAKNQKKAADVISVSVDKMDRLLELAGELSTAGAAVLRNPEVKKITQPGFCQACSRLEEKSGELEELAVSMRMMPLTGLFQRMRRVVYDVAHKLGKEVETEVKGADVEADRNIVEHITGPLMHLVRNAVDHGIEDDARERVRAGKPEKGHIGLEAEAGSGRIIISVSDDGRGMDKARLYEAAKARGLTGARTMGDYTDEEIYRFITLPGFSTRNTVTEFSGRGVGMDVVARCLSEIGGSLRISSRSGSGSRMSMSIPTSFAALNGVPGQKGRDSG